MLLQAKTNEVQMKGERESQKNLNDNLNKRNKAGNKADDRGMIGVDKSLTGQEGHCETSRSGLSPLYVGARKDVEQRGGRRCSHGGGACMRGYLVTCGTVGL